MGQLGETFKNRRAECNLSLKEVENATSIRMGYLKAIEDGQMENLISPVYAQGFVKQYAAFLGLDGDALIRQHAHVFHKPENQRFDYGIGTLEKRPTPGGGVKSLPSVLWIALFGGVLLLAWLVARYLEVF